MPKIITMHSIQTWSKVIQWVFWFVHSTFVWCHLFLRNFLFTEKCQWIVHITYSKTLQSNRKHKRNADSKVNERNRCHAIDNNKFLWKNYIKAIHLVMIWCCFAIFVLRITIDRSLIPKNPNKLTFLKSFQRPLNRSNKKTSHHNCNQLV